MLPNCRKFSRESPGYKEKIIVGYYLVLYKYPFKTWLSNIKGINLSEQDKKVTKILEGLEKLSDVDMGN